MLQGAEKPPRTTGPPSWDAPALPCRCPSKGRHISLLPIGHMGPEGVDGPGPEVGKGLGRTRLSRGLGVGCLRHVGGVFVFCSSPGGSGLGGQLWSLQQSTGNPSHAFFPQLLFHF